MTKPVTTDRESYFVRGLAVVVLLGVAIRIAVSIAAGIAYMADTPDADFGLGTGIDAGEAFLTLGGAGDGVSVLLALVAAGLTWWLLRAGEPGEWLRSTTAFIFALIALSAAAQIVGWLVRFKDVVDADGFQWAQLIRATGDSLAFALVAVGGLVATRRLALLSAPGWDAAIDGDPLVFAVDRQSGDVRAYFTVDAAARGTHVYSIEDDEYDFYTDEGGVIAASIEHDRVMLRLTDDNNREELLKRLKQFVVRRGIHVDVLDADDTTAYAVPISDWQWLQLWPGWLRWMGRLTRRR